MKYWKTFNFFAIVLMLLSCDEPVCENTNTILASNGSETLEYKEELFRQLEKSESEDLSYFFAGYFPENETDHILVNIHGKNFCGRAKILVTDRRKLKGIRQNGGASYVGAELKGFRMDMRKDSTGIEFLFKNLDYILD